MQKASWCYACDSVKCNDQDNTVVSNKAFSTLNIEYALHSELPMKLSRIWLLLPYSLVQEHIEYKICSKGT